MENPHLNESDMIPTTPDNEMISQEEANEKIWNQLKKRNMNILEERLSDDLTDINFSPDSYREEAIKYIVKQYGFQEMFIGKLLSIDQL